MRSGRRDCGFTAVELLLSLGLTAMVMALTMPFVHVQKRLWERREERREAGRALAGAMSWITRDLQQAGYHDSGPPLRQIATDTLAYVVSRDEADPDGFSAANRRLITVWIDESDLKYRIQTPQDPPAEGWERGSTQVLASGIRSVRCRGLDRRGEVTTAAERVSIVDCALTGSAGDEDRLLVRLRTAGRP